MPSNHPTLEDFAVFLEGTSRQTPHPRRAGVVRHLLSGCAVCRRRLSAVGWDQHRLARLLESVQRKGICW